MEEETTRRVSTRGRGACVAGAVRAGERHGTSLIGAPSLVARLREVILPQTRDNTNRGSGRRILLDGNIPNEVYIARMETSFAIIAEPNRRAILGLLASSEQSVGDIERQLGMPQPSVSKHLRVLREAGFVEARVDAQRRVYRIRPEPLMEVDAWLADFRRLWNSHVDALERHLDRKAGRTPAKGRKR